MPILPHLSCTNHVSWIHNWMKTFWGCVHMHDHVHLTVCGVVFRIHHILEIQQMFRK